jgi:EAL domain-containing protein (putative c-di-GMP-specific phosphodiesterase class I)
MAAPAVPRQRDGEERRMSARDRQERGTEKSGVLRALRSAIDHDGISVAYQPIVSLNDARCVGFEALARWEGPDSPGVGPDVFVALAEQSGLIHALGDLVLGKAMDHLVRLRSTAGSGVWMAVNLSTAQLGDADLPDRVAALLAERSLNPALLHLEITESVLMDAVKNAQPTLLSLWRLGLRLSIDDFGTGYSSLSYLKRFPVSTLKVDRSFVSGLGVDADDEAIVRTVIAMAETLGMGVIAEGVESPEQAAALLAAGCELAQGYYYGRPMTPEDAVAWLARNVAAIPTSPSCAHTHDVVVYDSDAALARAVAQSFDIAFGQGRPCIGVMTAAHRDDLRAALATRGVAVSAVEDAGMLLLLDATDTLDRFVVDGVVDRHRFDDTISRLVRAVGKRGTPWVYGEMVQVLWSGGQAELALELERHWNELAACTDFDLLCGYRAADVYEPAQARSTRRMFHAHHHMERLIGV